jgi:hypothetical protein
MKRVWFAALFAVLIAALCVFENVLNKKTNGFSERLLAVATETEDTQNVNLGENTKNKAQQAEELENEWNRLRPFYEIVLADEPADTLTTKVGLLRFLETESEFKAACAEIYELLERAKESGRLSIARIF